MNRPIHKLTSADHPSPWEMAWFAFRARALQARRMIKDARGDVARLSLSSPAEFPFVIAESVSALDTGSDPRERSLLLGKKQNLRLACQRINNRVLEAGETFSLWRQLGPPWKWRGFKLGREVREGCIIPTTGGGLCQLSGSLLEVALQQGFEIIERHHHTALPRDIHYQEQRDATLFWNYVDLRFRAPAPVLIEAFLSRDALVVRLRAREQEEKTAPYLVAGKQDHPQPAQDIQSCFVCGKVECIRCQPTARPDPQHRGKTAFLVDHYQPEFDAYIQARRQPGDTLLLPYQTARDPYRWDSGGFASSRTFPWLRVRQSIALRRAVTRGMTVAQVHFEFARRLARKYAAHIDHEVENLVISQAMLPHLWQLGVLGGRSFDVLMYREPLVRLEKNLDAALQRYPEGGTLGEFRSPAGFAELEQQALNAAERIITPHAQIASQFDNSFRLNWATAQPFARTAPDDRGRDIILFCGPTLARKGAHAVREAVRRMGITITVLGSDLEGRDFWKGLPVVHSDPATLQWERVYAVLQPALFEYWPRNLLRAHAAGAHLLISKGCGIEENHESGIHHVPFGDPDALIETLESLLNNKGEVKCV